jgi:hypothetical protein
MDDRDDPQLAADAALRLVQSIVSREIVRVR